VHVPPELESGPLLEVLKRHGVEFVLIGGLASVHWGSPFITRDLDITPQRSQENLDRLSSALTELGATIRIDAEPEGIPFAHTGASLGENLIWNLRTSYGDLDISFVPSGTAGFEDLAREAADERIQGIDVRVASLADVIRSKQAANRPKDQRVLPTLREILASRNPRNHS
jgi:hypothetical protein